jgi:pimeloyl-ACP methyl ester carboxylesterase
MSTPHRNRNPAYFRTVAGSLYGGRSRTPHGSPVHEDAQRFAAPPSYAGYVGQLFAITGWTSLPWLHQIHHRTLVMAGNDDPIVPLANGYILTWCIPRAQLHVIRRGGHLFLLEEPHHSATVITTFLNHENVATPPTTPTSPSPGM